MSLKLNMQEIKRLNNAAVRAMEQTVDALQTEIRTAQVMPYDNGDMQNNDTFTETSVHDHDIESRLITGSVQRAGCIITRNITFKPLTTQMQEASGWNRGSMEKKRISHRRHLTRCTKRR